MISLDELYARLETDPNEVLNVSVCVYLMLARSSHGQEPGGND